MYRKRLIYSLTYTSILKCYFKVCQSWKKLGIRMNLSCYIGYIQSQEKSNSASLRMLLRLWSSAKPESYNVKNLKRVLAAEVSIERTLHWSYVFCESFARLYH